MLVQEGEGASQHSVQQNDFVLVSSATGSDAVSCYFLGVVHTLKEGLLIIRTVLSPELAAKSPEEANRFNLLVARAQQDSIWSVSRLCTLNNYNRTFIGIQNSMEMGQMTNQILDPSFVTIKDNQFSSSAACSSYLIKQGVLLVDGGYKCGKTQLIPQMVQGYKQVTDDIKKAEAARAQKMSNLPKKTVQ